MSCLGHDHCEFRVALTAASSDDQASRADEMCSMTIPHLRDEEQVYAAITALVDPRLVEEFEGDHVRIDQAPEELAAHQFDPAGRGRAMNELTSAVDDHIRLEETVLFPVALAALAKRPSPEAAATT